MTEQNTKEAGASEFADPVSLFAVARIAWRHRKLVIAATAACTAVALAAALLMTPQYRAQVTVMPVTSDLASGGGVAQLMRGLGGLAALAGVGLGGGSNRDEIVEYLRSKTFTMEFIREKDLLPVLFHRDWDQAAGRWKVRYGRIPTPGDAYEVFTEDVRAINEDKKTGLVRVSITWSDPVVAAEWADELVARANARLRERAIEESVRSIEYLQREGKKTSVVAVQEAIAKLTEEQVKSVMFANVRSDYALKVIDPAVVPEPDEIVRPKRVLMVAVGMIVGFMVGLLLALGREHLAVGRRDRVLP